MAKKGLVLGLTSPKPKPDRAEPEPMVRVIVTAIGDVGKTLMWLDSRRETPGQ